MNELDVLETWHPTERAATPDAEPAARAALDGVMARRAPSTGRRLAGRALIAAAVTTALVTGGVVVARRMVDDGLDKVKKVHVGGLDVPEPGAPMNVLVIGSDSRAFVDTAQEAQSFGSAAKEGGQRSDTMMLVRIAGDHATGVSIPRDVMVPDGTGKRVLINSFFNRGPEALVAAVRATTGQPIDHYLQVDFETFIRVVDDLGGVRMYVPVPMRDLYSGLDLRTTGCTTFDGNSALGWARSRHAELLEDGRWIDASPHADLDRIARQHALLRAVGTQLRAKVGDDFGLARRIVDRVFASLAVDAGMDRATVASFAADLVRPGRLDLVTVPNEPDAEPGRLRLPERPAGEDFFSWATRAGAPDAGAAAASPSPGASC
jgi:LCP family protein required for cell wall assembly